MYVRKTYIADDGKEFKYEAECRAYEAELFNKNYSAILNPFIALFNRGGMPIIYDYTNGICYAYVRDIPDWEDEVFMDKWELVVPGNLTAAIGDYGVGWYFKDDYNNWHSWSQKEKMHNQMKQAFEKMAELI